MLHRHYCPNKPANAGIAQRGYLQNCNWKLRKVLTRKIKKQAYRYDIKVDARFGVRNNQVKRKAAEKIQGAASKIAKEAANKPAVEEFAASQAARKALRAAKKGRAAKALCPFCR